MSVVTREEIKKIMVEESAFFPPATEPKLGWGIMACERVATLVEERLREMVCSECGERWVGLDDHIAHIVETNRLLYSSLTARGERITRAQYEAEREGR